MQTLLNELSLGFADPTETIRIILRMLVAMLLGSVLGYEREQLRKAAGLRTHILVALGSAIFVLAPLEAGMPASDVSRVVQGVAAGIGFIGAGAILKLEADREIKGLTTAASIWMTAAVGIAAGSRPVRPRRDRDLSRLDHARLARAPRDRRARRRSLRRLAPER